MRTLVFETYYRLCYSAPFRFDNAISEEVVKERMREKSNRVTEQSHSLANLGGFFEYDAKYSVSIVDMNLVAPDSHQKDFGEMKK
ncbi:hypothetical protein TNCV_5084181 [Trichonephila clavipes]|nr:hypothetical protein TNCV_5084181 [Trichonephila clavipes]